MKDNILNSTGLKQISGGDADKSSSIPYGNKKYMKELKNYSERERESC